MKAIADWIGNDASPHHIRWILPHLITVYSAIFKIIWTEKYEVYRRGQKSTSEVMFVPDMRSLEEGPYQYTKYMEER